MKDRTTAIRARGDKAPPLHEGDTVFVEGEYGEFTVDGFRAEGTLVDCIGHASGKRLCVPRYQADGGWLMPVDSGSEETR